MDLNSRRVRSSTRSLLAALLIAGSSITLLSTAIGCQSSVTAALPVAGTPVPLYQPPPAPPTGPVADNSRCFVCHANYEEEALSVTHAKANVGCIRCHGVSSPHSTDEDGLTAPDRMFRKEVLRLNCLTCHDWMRLIASDKTKVGRTDFQEKPDHLAVLEGRVRDKRYCTDCHGEHRMYYRTRAWDKRSGVLTAKDGTPRMLPAAPK